MTSKKLRIVIKLGTGVLTRADGPRLDENQFTEIAENIGGLVRDGHQVILVSSGAVGAGLEVLGLTNYPEDTRTRQACAALGQIQLIQRYERLFGQRGIRVAQLLLTQADIQTQERGAKIVDTLETLLNAGPILPIINENDSVAVEELMLGDNDRLASAVAVVAKADLMILLTEVDGLLPNAPEDGSPIEPIPEVTDVAAAKLMVQPIKGRFSMGGMGSKLDSIQTVVAAGIPAVIASGHRLEQLAEIVGGGGLCSRFPVAS